MVNGMSAMAHFQIQLKQLLLNEAAKRGSPISQRELAKETGLNLTTVSRWYRDDVKLLDPDSLQTFMEFFQCGFEDLVKIVPDAKQKQAQEG